MKWLLLAVLSGCAMTAAQKRDDLMFDIHTYQEGLVWKRYDHSADYIPQAKKEAFLDAHDAADEELQIDEYEVQRVHLESGKDHAIVQVKYRWHLDSEGIVKETVVEEEWSAVGAKAWTIVSEHRKHGAHMPSIEDDPEASR